MEGFWTVPSDGCTKGKEAVPVHLIDPSVRSTVKVATTESALVVPNGVPGHFVEPMRAVVTGEVLSDVDP